MNKLEVIKLAKEGKSYKYIGEIYNVSRQRIEQIVSGRKNSSNIVIKKLWFRDKDICQWCDCELGYYQNKRIIHHIDLNPGNNNLENLIMLCNLCHKEFHKLERIQLKYEMANVSP